MHFAPLSPTVPFVGGKIPDEVQRMLKQEGYQALVDGLAAKYGG